MSGERVGAVVHVVWRGHVGGIERLVNDLAAEQRRRGIRVTVAFGQCEGPYVDGIRAAGAEVIDLRLASGYDLRPGRVFAGARALRRADVVHMHGFNLSVGLLAVASGRPIVFTEHGTFGLGREIRGREQLKRRMQRLFLKRSVRVVAANSGHTAQRMKEIYGVDVAGIAVVHNGTAQFPSPTTTASDGELHAVVVGRLVPFKRVHRAIEAVGRAALGHRIRLDIIGEGIEEPALRRQVAALGLNGQVRFLGLRNDVHEILAAADVLVHPSQNEPFGLAVLEATASGALPIIFADAGGALEVLPPDGVVVDGVEELAQALDRLVDSPALGPEARRLRADWARRRFPISATADLYDQLYREAVAQ